MWRVRYQFLKSKAKKVVEAYEAMILADEVAHEAYKLGMPNWQKLHADSAEAYEVWTQTISELGGLRNGNFRARRASIYRSNDNPTDLA